MVTKLCIQQERHDDTFVFSFFFLVTRGRLYTDEPFDVDLDRFKLFAHDNPMPLAGSLGESSPLAESLD